MYYTVNVSVEVETDDKIKKVNEKYLVDAESVTHAESIINLEFGKEYRQFTVKSITETKYVDVLPIIKNVTPSIKKDFLPGLE